MELKISYGSREEFITEWEKNISKGGIFIRGGPSPAVRQKVKVVIEVTDSGSSFELDGEAVHVSPAGVGVQLEPLASQTSEAMKKILTAQIPPAQDETPTQSASSGDATYQNIQNMTRHEKLALARKGGMNERAILMRDRDPQVVMNVILNPRLTMAEVMQLTASQSLTLDMVKLILNKPEWLSNETVCTNLVLNPKTPLPQALSLLNRLSEKTLRMLAKRPIKQAIKTAALKSFIKK